MRLGSFGVLFEVSAFCLVLGGCSGQQDAAWDCHRVNVPGGQTVECVGESSQSLVTDYPCATVDYDPDFVCPPEEGSTTDGTGDYGTKTTISSSGAYGIGDISGSSGGSGSITPLTPECYYVPDLDYCPPGSYGGGELFGDTGGGTAGGNGNGNGGSNGGSGGSGNGGSGSGETFGDGSGGTGSGSGGTGSGTGGTSGSGSGETFGDGSGGSSSGGGGGGHFNCSQNGTEIVCKKPPVCAEGLHPSPCGACVPDSESADKDCVSQNEGGCWFTGGGFILDADGKDTYGGNGKPMKDGRIQGEWNHVDHGTQNHAHGKVQYLVCRVADGPGPSQPGAKKGLVANQVYFGGPARWRSNDVWSDGYWFDVVAEDHGEPGNVKTNGATQKGTMPDWYHFTIRNESDPVAGVSGAVVYETEGPFEGGNFQLHPNNNGHPYTPSALPSWVSFEH